MVNNMSKEQDLGRTNAQQMNIRAARTIADTVKSTLGPMGMDKMLVDGHGNVIVTNDGATILREVDVSHPGGKMIAEVAKTQENLCYDGTTSTVVLAGALLGNTESLFARGLHPNVICRGYHEASLMATTYLSNEVAMLAEGREEYLKIARTAITGKTLENALDKVSELCVSAVEQAGSAESVRVVSFPGGSLDDSYLFGGVIVNKDFVLEVEDEKESYRHFMLINTGLDVEKNEENVQVQIDASSYSSYKSAGKADLISNAKRIVEAFDNKHGIVFVRDSVNDHVCAFLKKHGIMAVRRTPESVIRALKRATDSVIFQTVDDISSYTSTNITREKHNDVWHLFVSNNTGESKEATLVLRGATSHTLEEVERGFDDALGVVSLVMANDRIVVGAGNAYARMAVYLRNHAAQVGGRAQMAIEAFADALESIPATIAENAGQDPLDTILEMRHQLMEGKTSVGPDVENGGVCDVLALGVIEPVELVRQAVLSAAEVTNAILRIDDIIARRGME